MSGIALFNDARLTRQHRQLITAGLSAVCYGAWAYYANLGSDLRLLSTLIQFTGSFIAGYFVAAIVESVFARLSDPWRFPVAAVVPFWSTLAMFALIHIYVGTAEVVKTLLPNFIIGTAYFIVYCHKLKTPSH